MFGLEYSTSMHKPTLSKQHLLTIIVLFMLVGNRYTLHNVSATESSPVQLLIEMKQSSLLIVDSSGHRVQSHNPNNPMIPASTMKLLTALLSLRTWGTAHRFTTDFALDHDNHLWVKGYGDPYLISEEIDLIVLGLKNKGLKKISGIGIDDSYFTSRIIVPGQSKTDNPYDAPLSALAANFNTINVQRKNQKTLSAEIQTPITPLIKQLAKKLPTGTHRINLGDQAHSSHYFAEILMAKLEKQNVQVTQKLITGTFPDTRFPFYRHQNSHDLSEVISAMLQYSNNFIANQLFLLLGVEEKGEPATMRKSQLVVESRIHKLFAWQDYTVEEGAGLSRNNRLSAKQLIDVLKQFLPYRDLLSHQNNRILAKSGTLKGISTYAGYLFRSAQWMPFALMINQPVKYNLRKRVALELLN